MWGQLEELEVGQDGEEIQGLLNLLLGVAEQMCIVAGGEGEMDLMRMLSEGCCFCPEISQNPSH